MRRLGVPSEIRFGRGGSSHSILPSSSSTRRTSNHVSAHAHAHPPNLKEDGQDPVWSFGKVMAEHIKRRPRQLVEEQKVSAWKHREKVRTRHQAVRDDDNSSTSNMGIGSSRDAVYSSE